MKFLIIAFYLIILYPKGETEYYSYCNARFSFCIEYPSTFIRLPPPENGDGLIFQSVDKKTEIRAFGSLAVEDFDKLSQEYALATSDIKVTYKKNSKNWFIIAGITDQGKVLYRKTCKRKVDYMGQPSTSVFQTLMIEYPKSQEEFYKNYCEKIVESLK